MLKAYFTGQLNAQDNTWSASGDTQEAEIPNDHPECYAKPPLHTLTGLYTPATQVPKECFCGKEKYRTKGYRPRVFNSNRENSAPVSISLNLETITSIWTEP